MMRGGGFEPPPLGYEFDNDLVPFLPFSDLDRPCSTVFYGVLPCSVLDLFFARMMHSHYVSLILEASACKRSSAAVTTA